MTKVRQRGPELAEYGTGEHGASSGVEFDFSIVDHLRWYQIEACQSAKKDRGLELRKGTHLALPGAPEGRLVAGKDTPAGRRMPGSRAREVSSAVERLLYTQLVGGSIPSPPTNVALRVSRWCANAAGSRIADLLPSMRRPTGVKGASGSGDWWFGSGLKSSRQASIRTQFGSVESRVHGGVQPVEVLQSH